MASGSSSSHTKAREKGKRFCFEVVSPYNSYALQAESEAANDIVESIEEGEEDEEDDAPEEEEDYSDDTLDLDA